MDAKDGAVKNRVDNDLSPIPGLILGSILLLVGCYEDPVGYSHAQDRLCRHDAVRTQEGQRGKTMKHFTTEEWIDFVNQVVSPGALDEMENHLKQGCKRCQQAVSVWQRVQKSAAAEKNYQPPAETLRIVKSAFADAGLQGQRQESL